MAAAGRLRRTITLAATHVALSLLMFALWEVAQLPLYAIWAEKGVRASLGVASHCTPGDVSIASSPVLRYRPEPSCTVDRRSRISLATGAPTFG